MTKEAIKSAAKSNNEKGTSFADPNPTTGGGTHVSRRGSRGPGGLDAKEIQKVFEKGELDLNLYMIKKKRTVCHCVCIPASPTVLDHSA